MTSPSRAWLKPFLEPLKPIFREVLAMSFFVNLLALAVPVFTLQVYDRVIASAGIMTLWGLAICMIFVIIFEKLHKQIFPKPHHELPSHFKIGQYKHKKSALIPSISS